MLELTNLIKSSLKRLSDAPAESNLLFGADVQFTEDAIKQLQIEGVGDILKDVSTKINIPLLGTGQKM